MSKAAATLLKAEEVKVQTVGNGWWYPFPISGVFMAGVWPQLGLLTAHLAAKSAKTTAPTAMYNDDKRWSWLTTTALNLFCEDYPPDLLQ